MYELIISVPSADLIGNVYLFKNEKQLTEKMLDLLLKEIEDELSIPFRQNEIQDRMELIIEKDFEKIINVNTASDTLMLNDDEELEDKKYEFFREVSFVIDKTLPIKNISKEELKKEIMKNLEGIKNSKVITIDFQTKKEELKNIWEKEKKINLLPFEIYEELALKTKKYITLEVRKNKMIYYGGELTW